MVPKKVYPVRKTKKNGREKQTQVKKTKVWCNKEGKSVFSNSSDLCVTFIFQHIPLDNQCILQFTFNTGNEQRRKYDDVTKNNKEYLIKNSKQHHNKKGKLCNKRDSYICIV